ncbi:MAG: hypothetical protein ABEJ35_06495 [Halobacteriaceae archaeon]
MAPFTPLPVVDDFLRQFDVGQVLLLVLVLAVLGSLPLRSRKILSLNLVVFGLLFLVTPSTLAPIEYKFLGLGLLVASPVLYMTADR